MWKIDGNKTYIVGLAMIGYLLWQQASGGVIDQEIIYGGLAAMGLTLRHSISKAGGGANGSAS